MELSPAFWVAVSFVIFVAIAWNSVRRIFLKTIGNYRNSISSYLSNLYSQKEEASILLEKSNQELQNSHLNGYVLNAHKTAKEIIEKSSKNVDAIHKSFNDDVQKSVSSVKDSLQKEFSTEILDSASHIVKAYLRKHQQEFNRIAANKVMEYL